MWDESSVGNSPSLRSSQSPLQEPTPAVIKLVEKGSIAINGISLTVANIYENSFNVSIIPHTFHNTNFCLLREDHMVNIEFDPLARYLSKYNGK